MASADSARGDPRSGTAGFQASSRSYFLTSDNNNNQNHPQPVDVAKQHWEYWKVYKGWTFLLGNLKTLCPLHPFTSFNSLPTTAYQHFSTSTHYITLVSTNTAARHRSLVTNYLSFPFQLFSTSQYAQIISFTSS